jgi:hypothetical protein
VCRLANLLASRWLNLHLRRLMPCCQRLRQQALRLAARLGLVVRSQRARRLRKGRWMERMRKQLKEQRGLNWGAQRLARVLGLLRVLLEQQVQPSRLAAWGWARWQG